MTLNKAAELTKRGIAYFLIFILIYIVSENLIKGFNLIYSAAFPKPPTPPEIAYGKLESINIRTLPFDTSKTEIRLEIPTDKIPSFPQNIYVHEIEQEITSALKEERVKNVARTLGFTDSPRNESDSRRLWIENGGQKTFEAEVFYENFEYKTNKDYLESILSRGNSPTEADAQDAARSFFSLIGMWDYSFDDAEFNTVPVYIEEGLIKEATTPFREMLKFTFVNPKKTAYTTTEYNEKNEPLATDSKINILSRNPYISNIYTFTAITATNNSTKAEVVEAKYIYYNTTENKSYYPILDINEAWNAFYSGKGSLVYIKQEGSDYFAQNDSIENIKTVDIREIELAYFLDTEYIKYLQPIYVFKGVYTDNTREQGTVVFYLPAIDPQVLL